MGKMKYLIFLLFLSTSCTQNEPNEIIILKNIIERDFNEISTNENLIPIKLILKKDFSYYDNERFLIANSEKPLMTPTPPSINPSLNTHYGITVFSHLIRNSFISKKSISISNE